MNVIRNTLFILLSVCPMLVSAGPYQRLQFTLRQ